MTDDDRREVARRLRELNFNMSYRSKRDMWDELRRVVSEYNDRPFGGVYTFARLADLIEPNEPPYNLYTLYEAVFHRSPRCWECIEDDEVDELVDALLDICNSPGHEHIQRFQPSEPEVRCVAEVKVDGERLEKLAHDAAVKLTGIDRDELLEEVKELEKCAWYFGLDFDEDEPLRDRLKEASEAFAESARCIRKALGVDDG